MNLEKVIFAFFIVLALTLNFGFFLGSIDNPVHHSVYELFAAIVISLIATILKFGDRTHLGAVLLATSLVADLQLIAAAVLWGMAEHVMQSGLTPHIMAIIVSLSGGALLANITSVVLLVAETIAVRR
ncbi:hypothetical protein SCD_n01203 [Sulfuricella denitrificans skB26]|uniref:Uncharacterized protein n=1 Tax=Sulfuricella denitrificans (strain DSM 22764 / NBRC 105220 / skB26) TaxID=1163617 RepID=S6B2Y7_SULDS|nr:DUF6394 family protein [Sulfuricella denitrificans]BAN35032.1 hypothetical protein SCD_n01203 [Sulfuricella denitrificans skB26]